MSGLYSRAFGATLFPLLDRLNGTSIAVKYAELLEGEHLDRAVLARRQEAKLARAEKEALANQKLAASLTPLLVQQAMIDKLSANIQLMVVPQGQNFLMQLPTAGK